MEDLKINEDEKQPQNSRKDSKGRYQRSDRDEEYDGDETEDDMQNFKLSKKQLSLAIPTLTRSKHYQLRAS